MSKKRILEQTKEMTGIVFDLFLDAITKYDEEHPDNVTSDEATLNAAITMVYYIVSHHNNNDPVEIRKALDIMVEGILRQTRETNLKSIK